MRRRRYYRRRERGNLPMVCLAGAFALVCVCLLSAKFLFFMLAVILIALGFWLLSCG